MSTWYIVFMKIKNLVFSLLLLAFCLAANAATINVPAGESIQDAIDASVDGDLIMLEAGRYTGLIDYKGKAITIRGVGRATILDGKNLGTVVSFISGETFTSVLDRVTVFRGRAVQGGGILIKDSAPTISRNVIRLNRAEDQGSGLYIQGMAEDGRFASLFNNLIAQNKAVNKKNGDPHAIQVFNSSPGIINNTIIRNDSNGIFVSGSSSDPQIRNNIIAYNGTRGRFRRGRGICFIGVTPQEGTPVDYNLFFRNVEGDILAGENFRRIGDAQVALGLTSFNNNLHGNPRFRKLRRLNLRLRGRSAALDAGNPDDLLFGDLDGTRNDIGVTGGLFAHPDFI